MNANFAGVVEEVKQLSFDEKSELRDLIEVYLIEERRAEMLTNCRESLKELQSGDLKFSSDINELKAMLND